MSHQRNEAKSPRVPGLSEVGHSSRSAALMSRRGTFIGVGLVGLGVLIGGYLFSDVQPRSLLALTECAGACYRPNELAGLLASAGIQHAPSLLPLVVKESEKCISIKHPFPKEKFHFVVFPKRDIRDVANIAAEDGPFVLECLAHIRILVSENNLRSYHVRTNGPGLQHVTYLHFHLVAK